MKTFTAVLILLLTISEVAFGQQKERKRKVVDFDLKYDTTILFEFENSFDIGLSLRLNNSKIKKTAGFCKGTWGWRRFNISVENAQFDNGKIFYSPSRIYHSGHLIKIKIAPKNNPSLTKEFKIPVPHLVKFDMLYDTTAYLSPGFNINLEVRGEFSNHKSYSTIPDQNKRALRWSDFRVKCEGVEIQNYIYLNPSRDNIYNKLHLEASYVFDTTLKSYLSVPINYKAPYSFDFNGENGYMGRDGDRASGYDDNGNGYNGEDGDTGGDGQKGHYVKIYAKAFTFFQDTLLKIKAESSEVRDFLILNPKGGKLIVQANGGNGGKGGDGGKGSGGADESEEGDAGRGGNGGNGGRGGNGGDGGRIKIICDSVTLKYLSCIEIQNKGGLGGKGGEGGSKGSGGYQESGKVLWTILGNLIGIRSGSRGAGGDNGRSGEDGEPAEISIVSEHKLVDKIADFNQVDQENREY